MSAFYGFLMGLSFWQWIGVLLLAGIVGRVSIAWGVLVIKLLRG